MFQMAAHTDPISGDCEETEAYCPLKQIGCSETKVWLFLFYIQNKGKDRRNTFTWELFGLFERERTMSTLWVDLELI